MSMFKDYIIHFNPDKGYSYKTTPTDFFANKRLDLLQTTTKLLSDFDRLRDEFHLKDYDVWHELFKLGYGHSDFFEIDYNDSKYPSNYMCQPFILLDENIGTYRKYDRKYQVIRDIKLNAFLVPKPHIGPALQELAEILVYRNFSDILCAEHNHGHIASDLRREIFRDKTMTLRGLIDFLQNELPSYDKVRKEDEKHRWMSLTMQQIADIVNGKETSTFPISERVNVFFDSDGTIIYYNINNNPKDSSFVGSLRIPLEALWNRDWEMVENSFCQSGPCATYQTGTLKTLGVLDKAPVVILKDRFLTTKTK